MREYQGVTQKHGFCRFISESGVYATGYFKNDRYTREWHYFNADGSFKERRVYNWAGKRIYVDMAAKKKESTSLFGSGSEDTSDQIETSEN